jgi:hypothetical protein
MKGKKSTTTPLSPYLRNEFIFLFINGESIKKIKKI